MYACIADATTKDVFSDAKIKEVLMCSYCGNYCFVGTKECLLKPNLLKHKVYFTMK